MKIKVALIYLTIWISVCHSERLHEQIYSSIEGGAACFRRLNGTHQAGCSSSDKGAVGVVEMINNVTDALWVAQNSTAGPYMVVVSTSVFHDVVEILMEHSSKVAGVLLYDSAINKATAYSEESQCPNEYSSAPGSECSYQTKSNVWNVPGTGLIRRDIPFPIFFLPQSQADEIKKIEACYKRYNLNKDNQNGQPLCSLQLHSFMFAAVNSMVCMRRSASTAILTPTKVCDPLGDQNVYYSLFPRNKNQTAKVTLVTARIDTASLFDGLAPGAASSVVGLVTFITAASTLSKMIPDTNINTSDENILWTLFNGEAFDYIGSQRVAYDISRGAWPPNAPLTPTDIKLHVEIGQIGGSLKQNENSTAWPLHAFATENVNSLPEVTEFLNEIINNIRSYNMSVATELTGNFPPSSVHSFRRILSNVTENGQLPEVVLTDHGSTFSNQFYHSAIDEFDKISFKYHNISIGNNGTFISTDALIANGTMKNTEAQVKIANIATGLARTLYRKITKLPYTGSLTVSAHLVDEMLYCFLRSQACRLLMAADYGHSSSSEDTLPEKPTSLYVGVAAWPGSHALFAGNLLALLTGTQLGVNKTSCDAMSSTDFTYYWLKGWNHTGVCVQSTMNFSQAVSPAFITPDYDFTSGVYSTWTESVWQAMWARVFVTAGGGSARLAAIAGVIVTVIAAFLTYWLQRHSSTVFLNSGSIVNHDSATGILRTVNC